MPAVLDLTQAPYNVTQPWQGVDASVPDYTAAIQQAADDLRNQGWGLLDTGGTDGGRIMLPPFVVSISDKIVLHDGISLEGNSKASSRIMMRESFPGTTPGKHMIDLGDATSGHASFGGQLRNVHVSARKGVLAAAGNFAVYSNNAQDSGAIIDNCIIDGGTHFGGIKYMEGIGGASLVKFAEIVAISRKDALAIGNVPMVVKVSGSCMVEVDGFEPVVSWIDDAHPENGAVANSLGILCLGGTFIIKRVHGEAVRHPIYFGEWAGSSTPRYPGDTIGSPATDNFCQARVSFVTGGQGNTDLVWVDSTKWVGKLTLEHIMLKTPTITTALLSTTAGISSINSDIIDRIRV